MAVIPQKLARGLRKSGTVTWTSPLRQDGFKEYRDDTALSKAGIDLKVPLRDFWPRRGPVWDAIGQISEGVPIFVETKAHIPEAVSLPSKASGRSKSMIGRSLSNARRWYAPRATKPWRAHFYQYAQYANRLAHHYFLREVNGIESVLVFLYFTHDAEMQGRRSAAEWKGAIRLLHAALGIPAELERFKVFEVFVDVPTLKSGYAPAARLTGPESQRSFLSSRLASTSESSSSRNACSGIAPFMVLQDQHDAMLLSNS